MTVNTQAAQAGTAADDIIKQLATPQATIETDKATVNVLDVAKPTAPVETQPDNWEQRYKGYRSSTDKTIHNLRQKAIQFDLAQTENVALKEQLKDLSSKVPTSPNEMLELFSQEEVDGFTKMMDGRVGGLQGEVDRLQAEVEFNKQEKARANAQYEHNDVVAQVKASVPDYSKIDTNPAFKKWIGEPDQFGNIRYELLVKAKQEVPPDVGRIVSFYTEFASQHTQEQVGQTVPLAKQYTQQELLQNPVSTPSGSNPQGAPQSLGIQWNTATTSQFYKDKATGKIPPEEAEALEADLYRSLKR